MPKFPRMPVADAEENTIDQEWDALSDQYVVMPTKPPFEMPTQKDIIEAENTDFTVVSYKILEWNNYYRQMATGAEIMGKICDKKMANLRRLIGIRVRQNFTGTKKSMDEEIEEALFKDVRYAHLDREQTSWWAARKTNEDMETHTSKLYMLASRGVTSRATDLEMNRMLVHRIHRRVPE